MSLWRKNARKDENHTAVVAAFRALGCSVISLSAPGCPDLLVGFYGAGPRPVNVLVEVKRPLGPRGGKSHRELLDTQVAFGARWKGDRPWVVRSPAEAQALVAYYRDNAPCDPIDAPVAGQDPESAGLPRRAS